MANAIATKDQTSAATVSFLEVKAKRIRALSDRMKASLADGAIRIGLEYKQARETFPLDGRRGNNATRPGWAEWVEKNTPWSSNHANSFIAIAEKFKGDALVKKTTPEVLRILSASTTPETAIGEVRARLNRGDKVSTREVLKIVKDHKELPTRGQAIKEARESGKLVVARDGNLYSGATEDEMAAYSVRREAVYAVRRAVKTIADCDFNPNDWVKAAEDHWLTEFRLAELDAAIKWLTNVRPLVEKRQGVVNNERT